MKISRLLPGKFPIWSADPIQAPVFVFGSGRNGSTLLNRMLNQHPLLFAPTEQYFLGPTIIKFHLYRHLLNWRDLIKIVTGELDQSSGSHTWETGYGPQMSDLFESDNRSLQFVIDKIYRTYGMSQKSSFLKWVDTSSPNTRYFKEIYRTFPEAHYFFLIRDGRDVVNSYLKGGKKHFGELASPANASNHWNESVNAYLWMNRQAKITLIRYEELVTHPEKILSLICSELGISYHSQMLEYHQKKVPEGFQDEYYSNIVKPVFKESIGRWKKELDQDVLSQMMPILEKHLKRLDYL